MGTQLPPTKGHVYAGQPIGQTSPLFLIGPIRNQLCLFLHEASPECIS